MSDYKCIRTFIYAEHHEAFSYGQEISEDYYRKLSAKGKMNFQRKEIQSSGSGLYESHTTPPAPIDFDTSSNSSSSWDFGSSSDSSSSFDFGGGDGGGGGSTGDW